MASALSLVRRGISGINLRRNHEIVNVAVDTAVGAGASYALGRIHGQYRDHKHVEKLPAAVGIVGKIGSLVAHHYLGAGSMICGALDAVGQAGVNMHFIEKGIRDGFEKANRKVLVLPPGAATPANLPAGTSTVLGEIPAAPGVRVLSRDEINNLATMHR